MPHAEAVVDRRALVEIEHLSKAYVRGEQVVPVLTDINLVIREGDFVAMMGPSGSGKSTLLNLIAGIDKPDAGRLAIAGDDITQLQRHRTRRLACAHRRFHFPVLQPDAGADSLRERRAAAAADRAVARRATRARRAAARHGGSHRPHEALPERTVGRTAAARRNRPRARDGPAAGDRRRADRATSTASRRRTSSGCSTGLNIELGKTIVMVTHDPRAAEAAHHLIYLDKGQLTDTAPFGH